MATQAVTATARGGEGQGGEERRASLKRQEPHGDVMTCVVLLVIREALAWFYLTRKDVAMPLTRLQERKRRGNGRLVAMAECTSTAFMVICRAQKKNIYIYVAQQ